MNLWNSIICLNSRVSLVVIAIVLCSTLVLASVWAEEEEVVVIEVKSDEAVEVWIPTPEDILYQDSMYTIIQNTQNDITEIKQDIVHILERLDYDDGTYDSIRYVKGGKIDKRRNQ